MNRGPAEAGLAGLSHGLERLDGLLRAHHLACGPDVWQSAYRLLALLEERGRLPDSADALARVLGPVFCRSPEEQGRFPHLLHQCFEPAAATSDPAEFSSSPRIDFAAGQIRARRRGLRWAFWAAAASLLILGALHFWQRQIPVPLAPAPEPAPRTETALDAPAEVPKLAPDPWVPPRRLPLPTSPAVAAAVSRAGWALAALPGAFALLYLLWQYRGRRALTAGQADGEELFNQIRFARPLAPLFGGSETERALGELRASRIEVTGAMDVERTVEATARNAGYVEPVEATRRQVPVHLLLVRSLHPGDHTASLGDELAAEFRRQGLGVRRYRFGDDPRWLQEWQENDGGRYLELSRLAAEHGDARLLVISETGILFHPVSGRLRPWLADFAAWTDRAWLHPQDARAHHARVLQRADFLLLPLARDSLRQVAARLLGQAGPQAPPPPPLALPGLIAAQPETWLSPIRPYRADLPTLTAQLGDFLGDAGLLLLGAVAVFPKPHRNLTLALDYLLFGGTEEDLPERREPRLLRLSRLPWLTHSYLPDYVREHLLVSLDRGQRRRVADVWRRLLAQLTGGAESGGLSLDIALPSRHRLRQLLRDLRHRHRVTAPDDLIFASILLGGRLGLLDFRLPRAIARWFPHSRWLLDLRPLLGTLLVAALLEWSGGQLWQRGGRQALEGFEQRGLLAENARYRVRIRAQGDTGELAAALIPALAGQRFTSEPDTRAAAEPVAANVLSYPPGAEAVASRAAAVLQYTGYGVPVQLRPDAGGEAGVIRLDLVRSQQTGAVFRDGLLPADNGDRPVPLSLFRDPFAISEPKNPLPAGEGRVRAEAPDVPTRPSSERGDQALTPTGSAPLASLSPEGEGQSTQQFGPELIALPGGRFTMGCQETNCAYNDETPPHAVEIRPFALGRREVTRGEFARFVAETGYQTVAEKGRGCWADKNLNWRKPGFDQDDRHPVVCITWEDASKYTAWLSEKTGQPYRLPTEAEWEYAGRAGSLTAYFWGDSPDDAGLYAWYSKNSGVQTHPVGRKRPNAFGLQDLAGNVWEWTADCWHDNYQGAPADGTAWEAENCDRREVRGGSWYGDPLLLRSAIRVRFAPDVANIRLGFRLARAL